MTMTTKMVSALALTMMLGACAGRPPAPVSTVQVQDPGMGCPEILHESKANDDKIAALGRESGGKVAQNVAMGVAGLFIWPLWFAMDFQGTADKETAALQSRQQYLGSLALQRGCARSAPQPVIQPGDGSSQPTSATSPAATH